MAAVAAARASSAFVRSSGKIVSVRNLRNASSAESVASSSLLRRAAMRLAISSSSLASSLIFCSALVSAMCSPPLRCLPQLIGYRLQRAGIDGLAPVCAQPSALFQCRLHLPVLGGPCGRRLLDDFRLGHTF